MDPSSFKTVHASVRPARVAILVDSSDPDWRDTCLRIIEFYSQLWGGAYNIIVPTDGMKIDERFWTLLEAFDPDYIFRYQKSGEDLALSHPDRYSQILERQLDAFVTQNDASNRDVARVEIDKHLRQSWTSGFDIARTLQVEIKARLAPFWFEERTVDAQAITAGTHCPFHLTDITKIISNTEHPSYIGVIEATEDLLPKLWYGAVTGLLSTTATAVFARFNIGTTQSAFSNDNIGQLIDFTMGGEFPSFRTIRSDSPRPYDLNIVPYRVSMLQLGQYRSIRYQAWQERVIAVAGTTLQDFCLYYCLSRLRDHVVWILPSITEKSLGDDAAAQMSVSETSFLFRLWTSALHSH